MISITNQEGSFIIAEIAQAHDGSLGMAHSYIDAVKDSGADAVKFQAHFADKESSKEEKFRVEFSPQDKTRYDYWSRTSFTTEQWKGLIDHAHSIDLKFVCSPFSVYAAKMLIDYDVDLIKIGSGDIENTSLVDHLVDNKSPLLVSTGMSSWKEIDQIYNNLKSLGLLLTAGYEKRVDSITL